MTIRSESELRAALTEAHDLYSEAESDFREQRFLSDDELRAFMRDQASAEKAAIRQAIEEHRIYVVAGSGVRRVHSYDCSSLREQVDRDRAWSPWQHGDPENFRQDVAHGDGGPRMPKFWSRDDVEALSTYVTCQTCSPTLSHTKKSRGERTTKLTSLAARHFGRSLTALDGAPLGVLERIVTTVDTSGSSVLVETSTHTITEAEHTAVLVVPVEAQ
jgi:hypothetical protein